MPLVGDSRWRCAGLLPALTVYVVLLISGSPPVTAQSSQVTTDSLKVGFLYNFAKYTEWPQTSSAAVDQLRFCAVGSAPLSGQLALLHERRIANRPIDVRHRISAAELSTCHVVYLSHDEAERAESILKTLSGTPVLTVSDLPGFARQGGMIELVEMDNRMRFEINLAAARRTGLVMSSQLLKLATRVWQ